MIKQIFKKILGLKFFLFIKKYNQNKKFNLYIAKSIDNNSSKSIFNIVYKDSIWGKSKHGIGSSGGGSHDLNIISPYIKIINELLDKLNCKTIVDLGCGDFNIGKNFLNKCSYYIACDVSKLIIDFNKKKNLGKKVEFRELDICKNKLPNGDIAFVRQVLQHLPNSNIKKFVYNLNTFKPFKYLVVTEEMNYSKSKDPNIERTSTSVMNYVFKGSGVEIHKEPFCLNFQNMKTILEVKTNNEFKTIIKTILYEF